MEVRASNVHRLATQLEVNLAVGARLEAGALTVTLRTDGTAVTWSFWSTPRMSTV